jgi:hypothetical protein
MLRLASFSLLASLLVSCAAESGYTPIGEDKEDSFLVELDESSPALVSTFLCEEEEAGCDIEFEIAMLDSSEFPLSASAEALIFSIVLPDGITEVTPLVTRDSTTVDSEGWRNWSVPLIGLDAGEHSFTVKLADAQAAKVWVGTQMDTSVVDDLPFHGLDCSDTARVCESGVCIGIDEVFQCTSWCFMDAQCPSGVCSQDGLPVCLPE